MFIHLSQWNYVYICVYTYACLCLSLSLFISFFLWRREQSTDFLLWAFVGTVCINHSECNFNVIGKSLSITLIRLFHRWQTQCEMASESSECSRALTIPRFLHSDQLSGSRRDHGSSQRWRWHSLRLHHGHRGPMRGTSAAQGLWHIDWGITGA